MTCQNILPSANTGKNTASNTTKEELTDRRVKTIAPPIAGQEMHWDALVDSLGLRVSAGGAKAWIVQRRGNLAP